MVIFCFKFLTQTPTPLLRRPAASPPSLLPAVNCRVDFTLTTVHSRAQLPALPPDLQPQHAEHYFTYGPGSIVGELDFFLQRPRRWVGWVAARLGSACGQPSLPAGMWRQGWASAWRRT
jgi:hypothetical protein